MAGDATGEGELSEADLDAVIGELFDGDGTDAQSCGGGGVHSAAGADGNGDGSIGAADVIRVRAGGKPTVDLGVFPH